MIIDSSHKGPLQVYIAPGGKDGEGKVWQKLWQDKGTAPSEWGTLKLRAAGGRHWIKMPDIAPGKYLLRSEILALHASDARYDQNKDRGLQMYTSCMQVEIPADAVAKGKPTLSTEGAVAFPGAYKYDDTKGVHYSIYTNIATALANYEPPGGPIWKGPGSNGEGGFGTGPGAKNLRAR